MMISSFIKIGIGLLGDVLSLCMDEEVAGCHLLKVVSHQEYRS